MGEVLYEAQSHDHSVFNSPQVVVRASYSGRADLSTEQAPKAFGFSGCQKGFHVGSHNCLLASSLLDEDPYSQPMGNGRESCDVIPECGLYGTLRDCCFQASRLHMTCQDGSRGLQGATGMNPASL